MSHVYDLNTLRSEMDLEFAPLKLKDGKEEIVLRNLMRINEKDRKAVMAALESVQALKLDDEDREITEQDVSVLSQNISTILIAITANGKGQKLADAVDGDVALSMKLLNLWTEATQPGEAENSPA